MQPLHEKVTNLLDECLCAIRHHASQASRVSEGRFPAAEYLLTEAREYVDAACNLLEAGGPRASLAVTRWVLEAALDLLWATAEPNEVDGRLRQLVAEALRCETVCLEGLAGLYPGDNACLVGQADRAQQKMRSWFGQVKRLPSLGKRVESLKKRPHAKAIPSPYALYRVCCDAAHPGLAIWRRFALDPGGAGVPSEPPDSTQTAARILAASTFHLVAGAYCLTNLGDPDYLKAWWEREVAPLLAHH